MDFYVPSGVLHPSLFAVSGQTHVPVYSSKCKPAVHVTSIACVDIYEQSFCLVADYFAFEWNSSEDDFTYITIDTIVEHIANLLVWMSKEAVLAWAFLVCSLWWF